VARNQPLHVKALLPPLLPGKHKPRLVGRFSTPFEQSSAPIHKLILALSLHLKHVEFTQGKLTRDPSGAYWIERHGQVPEAVDGDSLVVRHGATPPIAQFIGEPAARRLKRLQKQLGDYLDIPTYDESKDFDKTFVDKRSSIVPGRTRASGAFADIRNPMALKLLERFGVGIRTVGDHFEIVLPEKAMAQPSPFGPIPAKLFGIDVEPASKSTPPNDDLIGEARQ